MGKNVQDKRSERSLVDVAATVVRSGSPADREWFAGVESADDTLSALQDVGAAHVDAAGEAFNAAAEAFEQARSALRESDAALSSLTLRRKAGVCYAIGSGVSAAQVADALGMTRQGVAKMVRVARIETAARDGKVKVSAAQVEKSPGKIDDKIKALLAGTDPTADQDQDQDQDPKSVAAQYAADLARIAKALDGKRTAVGYSEADRDHLAALAASAERIGRWATGALETLDAVKAKGRAA